MYWHLLLRLKSGWMCLFCFDFIHSPDRSSLGSSEPEVEAGQEKDCGLRHRGDAGRQAWRVQTLYLWKVSGIFFFFLEEFVFNLLF
jgi:hypothetical protein